MSRSVDVTRNLLVRRGGLRRGRRSLRLVLLPVLAALTFYLLWPYATLWRLDRAAVSGDPVDLHSVVDLDAVRAEIKKKLNKESDSTIGELSDPFIHWLEAGIQEAGSGAVDRLVTLDWVRGLLLRRGSGDGPLQDVSYAFFDAPDGFRVTLGSSDRNPVQVRLLLRNFAWRVSAVYY